MNAARVFVAVLLFAALCASASAIPISPASVTVLSSSSRPTPNASTSGVPAQGGNVTRIDISALTVTKSWQGYHGNITGNIRLDDASNQSFYAWGNTTPSGEVYASRNSTIQWTLINCTNVTERATEETYLGQSASDGDSVMHTFNGTSHPSFFVGNLNMTQNSCYSTNAFVNGSAQSSEFYQVLLSDNSSNTVYTTLIDADSYGYNGQLVDFQLMVGENEHIGAEGVTTYYFFVELS